MFNNVCMQDISFITTFGHVRAMFAVQYLIPTYTMPSRSNNDSCIGMGLRHLCDNSGIDPWCVKCSQLCVSIGMFIYTFCIRTTCFTIVIHSHPCWLSQIFKAFKVIDAQSAWSGNVSGLFAFGLHSLAWVFELTVSTMLMTLFSLVLTLSKFWSLECLAL